MENDRLMLQKLRCPVKHYDWGRPARDSKVARLARRNIVNWESELDKPYAEFLIGADDHGSSVLISSNTNEPLNWWLSRNPHLLGQKVRQIWGSDLPFMIKVVSVERTTRFQNYFGPAKMALAITEFEALCGLISFEELQVVVKNVPEVWNLISFGNAMSILNQNSGEENVENQVSSVFNQIMSANRNKVTEVGKLKNRLINDRQVRNLEEKEELALRLDEQSPGDISVIASFFLNYVKLKPGEAISIRSNTGHAYMSGECIECLVSVPQIDAQTPSRGPPEIVQGNVVDPHVTKYLLPSNEIEIRRCDFPKQDDGPLIFPTVPTPSIFLVMEGEALLDKKDRIGEGDVFFAAANARVPTIFPVSGLILYMVGFSQV